MLNTPTFTSPARQPSPFVFIIDSPSPQDLFEGYTIGMALRDALKSIGVPHFYTLAVNREALSAAMGQKLQNCVNQMQPFALATDAVPLIHLCMHGANEGIGLTDGSFIYWQELRQLLISHNQIKGYDPFVCMASCNGIAASSMAHAYDSVFSYLIGNTGPVLQSDLTVAYLAFYNQIFTKRATVEQSVITMKSASGDQNFFYASGQQIRDQKFNELTTGWQNPRW
ncbi:hypothetical protein [Aquitalea sp. ASV11]|uniref:hypothetical protein n=1 Tax=Aquitalea sp. ASV11 TaxID=2795103 RepID=UPI0018EDA562|nr:hypothetical protein [Aquitalea sp. ASV11]